MSNRAEHLVHERRRFIWVERFTGVFAVLNIVVVSIFTAPCVGSLGMMILAQIFSLLGRDREILWCICLVCCVGTGVALLFAAMLFHGMYQKKPSYVLAYFIFGVTLNITIVYCLVVQQYVVLKLKQEIIYDYSDYYNVILGICVVYSAVLCMVGWTYILMRFRRYRYRPIKC